MLLLTSVGLLLTVALLLLGIRVVILAIIGKCPLAESWERNRAWMAPLGIVVLLFWLAPWQGPVGTWEARQVVKKEGGLIIAGMPREVVDLPDDQRPRRGAWARVMEAETGVKVNIYSSPTLSFDYDRAFRSVMEYEVKRRFGEDIFLRVAQKAVALGDQEPEPERLLEQTGPGYIGWTEGRAVTRSGKVMNGTLVIRRPGQSERRLESRGVMITAWSVADGDVHIHSATREKEFHERFPLQP